MHIDNMNPPYHFSHNNSLSVACLLEHLICINSVDVPNAVRQISLDNDKDTGPRQVRLLKLSSFFFFHLFLLVGC